jgi:cell division protein FtsB
MGVMFLWFQGNDVAELNAEKQKRLEKIEKLKEEVKAIDEKIAELEG